MPSEEDRFLHALGACRPFLPAPKLHELVHLTGSASAAWESTDAFLRAHGWTEEQCAQFREHRNTWNVERSYARLQGSGMELISIDDARFPTILREIFDPPLVLYVRGGLREEELSVAVVGSRKATPYGKTATNLLVRPLASRGITIVSGLAYGIDAEAHRATLAVHGRTIAVLGGGSDDATLYPRAHRQLAREIVSSGGAVVSEYAPGTRSLGYFFPQRNRIIAGLSRAVVVVEASTESGALITARAALNENREVFVVPGPITSPLSAGTNALLREGASPARSADDITEALELLQVLTPRTETEAAREDQRPVRGDSYTLLHILSAEPLGIDEIVERSTLAPNVVSSLLTILELDGRVRDVGGKNYVRV